MADNRQRIDENTARINAITERLEKSRFADVSDTTATAGTVAKGKIFYDKDGVRTEGTYSINLQEKTATENGDVVPDDGYDGLSKVVVNVASSGSGTDILQWKCDNMKSLALEFKGFEGTEIQDISNLDTSKVTTMEEIFHNNMKLVSFPIKVLNTSSCKSLYNAFRNCRVVTELPTLTDVSKVTTFASMCDWCLKLKTLQRLNSISGTNFQQLVASCGELETVEYVDLIKATNVGSMLSSCSKLTNLTLKNIKIALQIGKSSTWGHLLTDESLINTAKELWDMTGSSSKALTVSTPSDAKFDVIYVKLVDVTDEMIAQDQYITNKKPCVVCESTDEGAMTLREYVISKNWTLAK